MKFIFLTLTINSINPLAPRILSIDGPIYFEKAYYNIISEQEFYQNFQTRGLVENYYFIPSLDFNILGETNYIIHIESKVYEAEHSFTLNIYDDKAPIIQGPDKIRITNYENFNALNYLSYYRGFDEFDGNIAVFLNESEESHDNYFEIGCQDSSKNKTYKKVTIEKTQNNFDILILQNKEITSYKNQVLKPNEVVEKLIEDNYLENISDYVATYINDDFNFYRCGKYNLSLKIEHRDKAFEIDLILNIIEKPRQNFFERLMLFFKKLLRIY